MSSRMQFEGGIFLVFLGFGFIVLSFAPVYAFLPPCAQWELRHSIPNGDSLNQEVGFFPVGTYVKVDVSAYGRNALISAQVLNVELENITKEEDLIGSGSVAFVVPKCNSYSLYLRNSYYPYGNDKVVSVQVSYYFYNLIFLISGVVMFLLGLGVIFYYEMKRRERNKMEKPSSISRMHTINEGKNME